MVLNGKRFGESQDSEPENLVVGQETQNVKLTIAKICIKLYCWVFRKLRKKGEVKGKHYSIFLSHQQENQVCFQWNNYY